MESVLLPLRCRFVAEMVANPFQNPTVDLETLSESRNQAGSDTRRAGEAYTAKHCLLSPDRSDVERERVF